MVKARHINIPIFIPHLGCLHDCVFCNQKIISGRAEFNKDGVDSEINSCLSTIDIESSAVEIAFFGGSFTGIDRSLMLNLLDTASRYIKKGLVKSIRISTRPDYIDEEILDILESYSVSDIELGIQSMNDDVLRACKRGHTAKDTERACILIKRRKFNLVGQMMTSLPLSTVEDEIYTAKKIASLGADGARIYPLVVFAGTELEQMLKSGVYIPPDEEKSIMRAGEVLEVFIDAKIPVIRIGLQSGKNLEDGKIAVGGFYSSAYGERVINYVYLKKIRRLLFGSEIKGKTLVIYAPKGSYSKVAGHKSCNLKKLYSETGAKVIKVIEKDDILCYNVIINVI